ncbi:MAG: family 20 glycosylhydrolase [Bryobacteraceae bacterium]|jgi:hexosaminidase
MLRPLLLLTLLSATAAAAPALMPLPLKVETAPGKLAIDGSFSVAATGYSDLRLESALNRFAARLSRQTGIPMLAARPSDAARATLRVECAARGAEYPSLGEDESYQLVVAPGGARLQAATIAGALHGLETFAQLVAPGAEGFQVASIHIEDSPRFPWRGLMLDVSRHWMPVEVVERNLDAMAAVKLNVFHWHLSDDQGFRVESRRFPRLQQLGSDGHFYTQADIRHVVAYASDRGIRVVPEFDIPGHTNSWLVGYPELASAPGPYSIGRTWGVYDPTMDPTREETYEFLDAFLGEMTQLFPDLYFHIGGDEVNGKQWNQSAAIQAFAKEHQLEGPRGLQAYFNQRIQKLLQKYGKIMIGWDEVLHPDLPPDTVVQSWRGQASLAEAASKGYRGILSHGYYLDHLSPARYHYGIDPLADAAQKLTPEEASRILGGEACMWAEYVSAETVDSRTWPRAAAIAERFWSPQEVTDVDSMYARLEAVSRALEWTGVEHRANYGPMLDRLAANRPAEPLRILADACEAVGLGGRSRAMKYTSLVPLNRFVDAARPESESVRALEQAAARVVSTKPASPADIARLREQFTGWAANDARFQPLAQDNALLAELRPLSQDLSALGSAGLRILDYLQSRRPAPKAWLSGQTKELDRMLKPRNEVVLAAVRPVKLLLDELARRGHK